MKKIIPCLMLLWLALPAAVQAQFTFTTNNDAITITGYTDTNPVVVIPDSTNDYPVTAIGNGAFSGSISLTRVIIPDSVTSIGYSAFSYCDHLTNMTIPASVTNIGDGAFYYCSSMEYIFFKGNAPLIDGVSGSTNVYPGVFNYASGGAVYYLPGTTGWGSTYGGHTATMWITPQIQTVDGNFGVFSNRFGFNLTGTTNLHVVVEWSAFVDHAWVTLLNCTITNGSIYWSEPVRTKLPGHFFRIRSITL